MFGRSWATSVSGLVSAAGAFILFSSAPPFSIHYPVAISALAGFMAIGGLANLGIQSKATSVSGVSEPRGGDHAEK
jgi:hypothetical protein